MVRGSQSHIADQTKSCTAAWSWFWILNTLINTMLTADQCLGLASQTCWSKGRVCLQGSEMCTQVCGCRRGQVQYICLCKSSWALEDLGSSSHHVTFTPPLRSHVCHATARVLWPCCVCVRPICGPFDIVWSRSKCTRTCTLRSVLVSTTAAGCTAGAGWVPLVVSYLSVYITPHQSHSSPESVSAYSWVLHKD